MAPTPTIRQVREAAQVLDQFATWAAETGSVPGMRDIDYVYAGVDAVTFLLEQPEVVKNLQVAESTLCELQ